MEDSWLDSTLRGAKSLGDTAGSFVAAFKGQQPAPVKKAQEIAKPAFPVWGWIAIAGGVVLVAVLAFRK